MVTVAAEAPHLVASAKAPLYRAAVSGALKRSFLRINAEAPTEMQEPP